jgi:hypothetical protein
MKRIFLFAASFFAFAQLSFAQDLRQSQVPAVIANSFKNTFSDARFVEWERDGTMYQVDFETGWNIDHEIWFKSTGEILRHKQDIKSKDLPATILQTLETTFKGYRISDVKMIKTETETTYTLEMNKFFEEWHLTLNEKGEILKQFQDN